MDALPAGHDGSVGGIGVLFKLANDAPSIGRRAGVVQDLFSSFLLSSPGISGSLLSFPPFSRWLQGEGRGSSSFSSVSFKSSVTRQLPFSYLTTNMMDVNNVNHTPPSFQTFLEQKVTERPGSNTICCLCFFFPCHMQLSIMFLFIFRQTVNTCLWIPRTSWESTRPRAGNRRTPA